MGHNTHGSSDAFFKSLVDIAAGLGTFPDGLEPLCNMEVSGVYPASAPIGI